MLISKKYILTIPFIFSLLLIFTSVSAIAFSSREYPYFYKSRRTLGMGGAYVAIGGGVDTLFYNPAGLSMMQEDDWETNIIGLDIEASKNMCDTVKLASSFDPKKCDGFVEDLLNSFDTNDIDGDGDSDDDKMRAVNDVLAKYRGENLHLRVDDFTMLGANFGEIAFGIGELSGIRLDALTHQGFGSNGFFELNSELMYGGVGGLSIKKFAEGLSLGLSFKYFHKDSVKHVFSAREMVDKQDDLEDYIMSDLKKSGDAIGFDFGSIYQFAQDSWLKPSVGLSAMDIGGTYFGEAGYMPMTFNLGFASKPDIKYFESLTVGIDYMDIFNTFEQDNNLGKRLRLGGELELFDVLLASMAVRTGLYQGYPSYGADLRLLIFEFSFLSYSEEVGAYAGQKEDKRTLVSLDIGW